MRILACAATVAIPVALFLTGCGSASNEGLRQREYYSYRYIPTSADTVFSSYEMARWRGDREVYELPGKAPALDDPSDRSRRPCAKPGPQFKPQPMVEMAGPPVTSYQGTDAVVTGGNDTRPWSEGGTRPWKEYPIGVMSKHVPNGLPLDREVLPIAGYDLRPKSRTGAGTDEIAAQPAGVLGVQPMWDWCMPGDTLKAIVPPPPLRNQNQK